jgi:hypothetical protein
VGTDRGPPTVGTAAKDLCAHGTQLQPTSGVSGNISGIIWVFFSKLAFGLCFWGDGQWEALERAAAAAGWGQLRLSSVWEAPRAETLLGVDGWFAEGKEKREGENMTGIA